MATTAIINDPERRARFERSIGHPVQVMPVPVQIVHPTKDGANKMLAYLLDVRAYTDAQLDALARVINEEFSQAITGADVREKGCPILSENVTIIIDDLPTIIALGELATAARASDYCDGCDDFLGPDMPCKQGYAPGDCGLFDEDQDDERGDA